MDMIDRYKKWTLTHVNDSDSESDSEVDIQNNSDDSDWNLTVRGTISPYIEEQQSNEDTGTLTRPPHENGSSSLEPVAANAAAMAEAAAAVSDHRLSQSMSQLDQPPSVVTSSSKLSPSKQQSPSHSAVTRSDLNIVRF